MPLAYIANPSPRRRKKSRKVSRKRRAVTVYKSNPSPPKRRKRRSVMKFKRNPSPRVRRFIGRATAGKGSLNLGAMLMPALGAGAGAVGVEVAMGYLPLPAALTTGPIKYAVKGAVAVGLGMLVAKFANKKAGEALAAGGLAIAAHDALREQALKLMPALKFGEYLDGVGYYSAGGNAGVGEYLGEVDYLPGGSESNFPGYMGPLDMAASDDEEIFA